MFQIFKPQTITMLTQPCTENIINQRGHVNSADTHALSIHVSGQGGYEHDCTFQRLLRFVFFVTVMDEYQHQSVIELYADDKVEYDRGRYDEG